ncbi:TonB-dependent receptor domain-containing protein [Sphingosinicella soli]|uniref:Outer membrane receptor protein involved in Fe transport n=1 Tax=Sphingosinicella soli TaxID=333708 RepID=A0A7W7F6V1_9SPHN|nr:TonB-dependent receptor [Sphingosinicella soli]MBB4632945.1 outer membrane receptor protein involved in Fe transport [Sphingosinicella soli]
MKLSIKRKLLVATAVIGLSMPGVAAAQQRIFDIPAQTANQSIPEFGRQAGVQIVAPGTMLRGLRTGAIKGAYDVRAALGELLRGTGLRIVADDGQTITLAAAEGAEAVSPYGIDANEIVVTAQKRSEPLRTIAASVQAVSGANIQSRSLRSVEDIARFIPSLSIAPETGIGDRNIILRGIAPSGGTQPTVVTYLDDILIPNSIDPMLYDVARVEVLKGPQGDLYGASAAGGLLRYVEERPDPSEIALDAEIRGSATEGGAGNYGGAGVVNLPLGDTAALRASAVYDNRGGYIDNLDPYTGARRKNVNDLERFTGRIAGLWEPTEAFELRVSAMYNSRINGAFSETDRNDRLPEGSPGSLTTSRFFPERISDKSWIFNVTANLDLGAGTLTSATGYVRQNIYRVLELRDIYNLDPDVIGFAYPGFDPDVNGPFVGNPNTELLAPSTRSERFRQFTQEVRFSSDWDFPVQLLAGAFYLRSTVRRTQFLGFSAPIPEFSEELYGADPGSLVETGFRGRERIEEIAGFANLRVAFDEERGELKAGVRYYDRKNPRLIVDTPGALFPNAVDVTAKDSGTLFSASASYKFTPETFAYARYAGGFRPGVGRILPGPVCNPDFQALGIDPSTIAPFTGPEKLNSYEAGVRQSSSDGRFSVGVTGYVIKYRDIQQSLVLPTCASQFDVNAGRATSKGFEIEARAAPTRYLSFAFNLGYSDARLDEGDPFSGGDAGEQLQYVPAWTVSVQQDYRAPVFGELDLIVRSDISYTDKRQTQFGLTGSSPDFATSLPDYTLVNAQVGVGRGDWEAVVFVDNLANTLPIYGTNQTRYFGSDGRTWSVGTPRTWGLRLRSSF